MNSKLHEKKPSRKLVLLMNEIDPSQSYSNQDVEQLRFLSIAHYIVGGLMALFSMFPVIHLAIGIAIVSGAFSDEADANQIPKAFGWLLVLLPAFAIVCGLAMSAMIVLAGRRLQARQTYTFCLIIAIIECLMMPFGTVLGIFTILVLQRPSVRELFDR